MRCFIAIFLCKKGLRFSGRRGRRPLQVTSKFAMSPIAVTSPTNQILNIATLSAREFHAFFIKTHKKIEKNYKNLFIFHKRCAIMIIEYR